jgi:hypothetical protein
MCVYAYCVCIDGGSISLDTHLYTHTHAHTHIHSQSHSHSYSHKNTHLNTHTHIHIYTLPRGSHKDDETVNVCMDVRVLLDKHANHGGTCVCVCVCVCMCVCMIVLISVCVCAGVQCELLVVVANSI